MQFIHWLLSSTHEKRIECSTAPNQSPTNQNAKEVNDQKSSDQQKHIIVFKQQSGVDQRGKSDAKSGKSSLKKYLKVLLACRNEIATACFYSTVNLKNPNDPITTRAQQHWVNSMKMKRDEAVSKGIVISKVLPISEATPTPSTNGESAPEKKEKSKGEKGRTVSRMKELLRWAAAAKSEKGEKYLGRKVLKFRNKPSLKAVPDDDDQLSYDSPKISFRWDVESCSTTSSVYSAISVASLKNNPNLNVVTLTSADHKNSAKKGGNWITTDSEFVVLEL